MSKTVFWSCADCGAEYDAAEAARVCCDGDEDDLGAASGTAYDYVGETNRVIIGP